jgi:hypothetical protein
MAEKEKKLARPAMDKLFDLSGLRPELPAQPAPDPLNDFFRPGPGPELPPIAIPKSKGGRPKGPPKTKKTFYLAYDLAGLKETQLNLARNAGLFIKDESDLVDLALELIEHLAANTEYTAIIHEIYKKRI